MMPDLTGQLIAVAGVLGGALIAAFVTWRRDRRKEPIDESTAAYANAKTLSDATTEWVIAVREDMTRMRADLDMLRAANASLRMEVESVRAENSMLRSENLILQSDLNAVYQWIEDGAKPPPPHRRTKY